jgi:dTMP kinase
MSKGVFITIEGIEGSGKSTQACLLAEYLRGAHLPVTETREPGGTEIGEMVRGILLSPSARALSAETELLLILACRADHVERVVKPALEHGDIVCSDRYADATIVYQGFGREMDLGLLRKLNEVATGGLAPDLTLLLDLDVETGLQRVAQRSGTNSTDRFEREALQFHKRVREGYIQVASDEPDRVKVVRADASIEVVHERIQAIVREFLSQAGVWPGVGG